MHTKKAFTLIELLVVIAIIAILAAMLFPVYAQAKAASHRAVAISNMKQVAISQMLYSSDYDDVIVPYWIQSSNPQAFLGRYWHGGLVQDAGITYYRPQEGLLYPYTRSNGIYNDPASISLPLAGVNWVDADKYWPSYAVNSGVVRSMFSAANARPLGQTALEMPSETIFCVDGGQWTAFSGLIRMFWLTAPSYRSLATGNWIDAAFIGNPPSMRAHNRHAGRANVAWMDSHASPRKGVQRPLDQGTPPAVWEGIYQSNLGEISKYPLPFQIAPTDPDAPRYNYYFSVDKTSGS